MGEPRAVRTAGSGDIPEEIWMLRLAWNGRFVLADDDFRNPCALPYLAFLSREEAEIAAEHLRADIDLACEPVRVKGPGARPT